jgi:hypothetical protein
VSDQSRSTRVASIALTTWTASNPFGEPTGFVLVHPIDAADGGGLAEIIANLGLKRLDADGDILPIGTEVLYASLRAQRVELCTAENVWLSHPVTDDWTGNAIGRRYVVLAIGTAPLAEDADAAAIAGYLAERSNVYAALVKIRVRFEQS